MKFTSSNIETLQKCEIFVFGSNLLGKHCSGAAHIAFEKFGAIWGKGVGMQGQSYAIPTLEINKEVLKYYILDFIDFAKTHPQLEFLVTRIGCGKAGYTDKDIAPFFAGACKLPNISLPGSFYDIIYNVYSDKPFDYLDKYLYMTRRTFAHYKPSVNDEWYKDRFVFFWKEQDNELGITKKCLSQWYYAPFMIDNQWYNCAEQYMMAEKARLFGDEPIRKQILKTADQATIKKLGRMVHGFQQDVWDRNKCDIILKGNVAKFSQNMPLKAFLLSTDFNILVEASPFDVIYGVGLSAESPEIWNPYKWRGQNLLGFTLMKVRDILSGNL